MSKLDSTNLQVLANYCAAAAESMGWTLMRTAHSTFVKETEDFSCQVLTRSGLTVASPKTFGATWYTGLDYGDVISRFDPRFWTVNFPRPMMAAVTTTGPQAMRVGLAARVRVEVGLDLWNLGFITELLRHGWQT